MAAHDDSEKRSTVNDLLLNASSALELASQLAPLLPVPFVPSIFASAKLIVDAANNVRQNKTDCANLAKRVAELTLDVSRQIHGREELAGDHLKAALEQLQVQFLEIQHFMEQQVSLNLLKHFIRRGSITASVNELRLKLDFTMRTFQTTSSIRMELQMSNFQRHMMKEKEWDGQYRIYRLGDLYLQRSLYKDQNAEYFQAEVRHRAAVVKLLRNLQNRAAFLENTTALKHLKHPNVAQLDGLSDGDMDEFYFIALKGALIPAMDYMKAVPVDRRCIEYLHLLSSTTDAELFLDDRSLQSSGDIFKLMVDFESRQPVIGAIEDFWPSYRYAEEQSWTTSFDKLMASCLRNRACRNYSIVPISPPPAAKYIYCDFPFEVRQLCSTPRTRLSAMKKAIDGFLFVMTDMLSSGMTPIEEILALFINCDVLRVFGKNVLGYLFYQTPSSAPLGSIGYLKFTQGGRPEFVVLDVMPEFKVTSKHQSCGKCGVGLSIDVADICWAYTLDNLSCCDTALNWTSGDIFLIQNGPSLARKHGLSLSDLVLIECHTVKRLAKILRNPHYTEPGQLYFHVLPLIGGKTQEPWAYFSLSSEPESPGEPLPVKRIDSGDYKTTFRSTIPELTAHILQYQEQSYMSLNPARLQLLKWIYGHYPYQE